MAVTAYLLWTFLIVEMYCWYEDETRKTCIVGGIVNILELF